MDRFTGREGGGSEPDPKMTIAERVERFMAAEYELGRAEIAMEQGVNKIGSPGSGYEDIKEAVATLKASAEYHARLVNEQDLDAAVAAQDVRAEEADVLRYRLSEMQKAQGVEMKAEYFEELESRMEQANETDNFQSQGRDQDEGQSR